MAVARQSRGSRVVVAWQSRGSCMVSTSHPTPGAGRQQGLDGPSMMVLIANAARLRSDQLPPESVEVCHCPPREPGQAGRGGDRRPPGGH
eukprot:1711132-Lingulodinium_polyedra.AAC.1